jgi:hypothetical protein
VLLRSSGGQDTFNPGAGPVPSGHAHDVVVHAGNTVRAAGTVLAAPGRPVRLCAPLGGAASGGTGITRHCDGVDLTGLDLGRLTDRAERGGVVTGAAAVVGTYRDGRIAVSRQTAPPAAQADDLPQPPCAAPPDGWPRGSAVDLGAALRYQQRHRAEVVEVAVLRPSPDHAVAYVLTAGDPNPAGKALEPTYGPRLCVFRSRYTTAQLDAARSAMRATASAASGDRLTTPFEAGGIGLARDGQACTPARVAIVTDTVARAVDGQPAGLVQLDVWLRPVS